LTWLDDLKRKQMKSDKVLKGDGRFEMGDLRYETIVRKTNLVFSELKA